MLIHVLEKYRLGVAVVHYSTGELTPCCKLSSRDEREGTWMVGLLQNESLNSRAMRRNLDSKVCVDMKAWMVGM